MAETGRGTHHGRSHAMERHPTAHSRHIEEARHAREMGLSHRKEKFSWKERPLWEKLVIIGLPAATTAILGIGAIRGGDSESPPAKPAPGFVRNNEGEFVPMQEHLSTSTTVVPTVPKPPGE